jgi:hypothetical protein
MDKENQIVPFLAGLRNGVSRLSEPGRRMPRFSRENPNV